MREFFEAFDAGSYDRPALIALLAVLAALWLSQRWRDRRAGRQAARQRAQTDFYESQRRAQQAYERFGPADPTTQEEVVGALICWQRWQDRDVATLRADGSATPVDWDAISLLQVLGEADASAVPM